MESSKYEKEVWVSFDAGGNSEILFRAQRPEPGLAGVLGKTRGAASYALPALRHLETRQQIHSNNGPNAPSWQQARPMPGPAPAKLPAATSIV